MSNPLKYFSLVFIGRKRGRIALRCPLFTVFVAIEATSDLTNKRRFKMKSKTGKMSWYYNSWIFRNW